MPSERLPKKATSARCPQCCRDFHLNPAVLRNPEQTHLTGIGALLTESWELLCQRGWNLLSIYLLSSLLIFTPLLLASSAFPDVVTGNRLVAWLCLLVGGSYCLLGLTWMTAALFQQVVNPQLKLRESLGLGWQTLGKFVWLQLLLFLTIGGGSLLLIIPGLLFSVWFLFSQYILAAEGIGGLTALEKSHQLVRGHWWAVCSRLVLLLLVSGAVATLTGHLPLIGATVNFVLTLLLIPFSLLYFQLVYQDLKRCQPGTAPKDVAGRWLYLSLPTLGWLLIPGLLMFTNSQSLPNSLPLADDSSALFSKFATPAAATLQELTEEQGQTPSPGNPAALSAVDYDRLLAQLQLAAPAQKGVSFGPATLEINHFWAGPNAPQLWLKLKLAQLPNLTLSSRHASRVLIDRVNDNFGKDLYNRGHSFESAAFQWVDTVSSRSAVDGYSGIRSIYLKPGTQANQISSIRGKLELQLPLSIESRQLGQKDIGSDIQIAGKTLTLEALSDNRISLKFHGKLIELLSIRAFNHQAEPLREAGVSWQQTGGQINLQQMFSGKIETVTIIVASDSLLRSYPFDISM
jgi:hypothetical protein